jgi:hypothetical protein
MYKRDLVLVFSTLVLALVSPAMADGAPAWPEYPAACVAEHGVCFHEFQTLMLFAADASTGDLAVGYIDAAMNDFMRQNPDGSNFIHVVDQEMSGEYCPVGEACWPFVEPGRISYSGFVNLDPASGGFAPACPASAMAHATVESPSGGLFTMDFFGVWIPTPQGGCQIHKLEIRLRPTS